MKYIEELLPGSCFVKNKQVFIVTTDHKNNGQKLCINLKDGSSRWLGGDVIVDSADIFTLDKENNLIAIKEREKEANAATKD